MVLGLILAGAAWDASTPWRVPEPAPRRPGGHSVTTAAAPLPADSLPPLGSGPAEGAAPAAGDPSALPAVLPLNRASAADLEALPGIGPVLARRIVAHREQFGPFRSPEELRAVRGVGPRLMARLRGRLRTGP